MSDLATWEIDHNAVGHGKLILNGEDVSNKIRGFSLEVFNNEPAVLGIFPNPGSGKIQGTGVVQVHGAGGDLSELNPAAIEEEAMKRMGWDSTHADKSIVEHVIDIIKEQYE